MHPSPSIGRGTTALRGPEGSNPELHALREKCWRCWLMIADLSPPAEARAKPASCWLGVVMRGHGGDIEPDR